MFIMFGNDSRDSLTKLDWESYWTVFEKVHEMCSSK
jgi:hypothetical protein